jgi:hypothetical protein
MRVLGEDKRYCLVVIDSLYNAMAGVKDLNKESDVSVQCSLSGSYSLVCRTRAVFINKVRTHVLRPMRAHHAYIIPACSS